MKKIISWSKILSLLLVFSLPSLATAARDRAVVRQEKRIALVIGNGAYLSSPLRNPVNDARGMARSLKNLGFEVDHRENAEHGTMEKAIRRFGKKLHKGGVGLFYFAGHGMQINGNNYLIPVDAEIESESDIRFEAVDAGRVLGKMEDAGNKLNIVILDACRDNPFSRSFRTKTQGLARMDAPAGSLIAYATAPGSVAADGEGRNGVYTKHLLRNLNTPGLKIEELLKKVRVDVMDETAQKQIPWEASSLTGDFYFNRKKTSTVVERPAPGVIGRLETRKLRWAKSLYDRGKKAEAENEIAKVLSGSKDDTAIAEAMYCQVLWHMTPNERETLEKLKAYYPDFRYLASLESEVSNREKKREAEKRRLETEKKRKRLLAKLKSLGMEFKYIKPGSFMMGSLSEESGWLEDVEKRHRVTLSKGYYIQTTEVTQGQWVAVMGSNPSYFKNCGDDCPVENVSWDDVQSFIKKLNQLEGLNKYRLPTEAEWEYAARAGSETAYCFGNDVNRLADYAWYGDNSTHPVGRRKANAWVLYDMHGSVSEWCQDWYGDYPSGSVVDPIGPSTGSRRVIRGGSWVDLAWDCRSAVRYGFELGSRGNDLGFRLALSPGQ